MNSILRIVSFMVLFSELFASLSRFSHQKCGLYGMPPCGYVPSSSGVTPTCAGAGKTFCEFVPNYPVHTIRLLLEKWGVENVNDLIVDETVDDFEATRFNDIPLFDQKPPNPHQTPTYPELPNAVPTDFRPNDGGGYNYPNPNKHQTPASPPLPPAAPTPGYLPPTNNGNGNGNGYTVNHGPGSDRYWTGFSYSIHQRPTNDDNNHILSEPYRFQPQPQPQPQHASNIGYYRSNPYVTEYDPAQWFKRYVRDVASRARPVPSNSSESMMPPPLPPARSDRQQSASNHIERSAPIDGRRNKRQSSGREQLCQTTYQYITPQAALNSQGNWMYIVNQVDATRQLVRTETCASSVCSGICQLPNGYTSRCEQKYVQKRLIALNADGTNLYTDTFWFPSCCACTIAAPT